MFDDLLDHPLATATMICVIIGQLSNLVANLCVIFGTR
jgi:hypothetical protein